MDKGSFSGNFAHTIDPKGRVTIPVSYREALGTGFTVALNTPRTAIALYPSDKWNEMSEQLNSIPITDARGQKYVRMVTSSSFTDNELDGQGRLLLPVFLRHKLSLDKNIRFVGMGAFLEIWDDALFSKESGEYEQNNEDLTDYVFEQYFKPKE